MKKIIKFWSIYFSVEVKADLQEIHTIGIDIIIIDESSFVGIKAICILDYVLRKISNIDAKFGNFKILYYGDFCQLNCVKD